MLQLQVDVVSCFLRRIQNHLARLVRYTILAVLGYGVLGEMLWVSLAEVVEYIIQDIVTTVFLFP